MLHKPVSHKDVGARSVKPNAGLPPAGTPGGGLGSPDEAELKRRPEETSEQIDARLEPDER